ncbi:MAG: NAD(P)-dependent glycerol-3-phosphate dehydrogenase [Lachnospiraceae bacterium]|nr:NAD(P)-dependent glycerol-3-phosphate dehydrogenase [Lachnospiraceae bacterium]
MADIGMIGAGSWGTALTYRLSGNGHRVEIWSIAQDEVDMINRYHEQKEKLPGTILPESVTASTDLRTVMMGKDMLVLAVPSPFTRSTAHKMAEYCKYGQLIVSVAKGIEESTLMTLSEIISQEIPQANVAVLSGPTHAEEVGKGMPTTIVAGASDEKTAKYVQDVFMNEVFRVYTSPDMLGMQIGAALKNVCALGAGIADGLGYGDNAKAALITRGISEISRLGIAMGGKSETFFGLTGIGDLIVTCASMHSRNRRAGILIGQGKSYEEAMREVNQVVEGVYSAKTARALGVKYGIELPIIEEVCRILFEGKNAAEAVRDLMLRDRKLEIGHLDWKNE